jgi:hypothetical protein
MGWFAPVPRTIGPGKRWRHSMVGAKAVYDPVDGYTKQRMAIFGGHRLWHGYSQENTQDNNWDTYVTRPIGGYLDDLWIYTKYLDFSFPGQTFKTNNGELDTQLCKICLVCFVVNNCTFPCMICET